MGDIVFFHADGTAEIIQANKEPHEVEKIVIYCQLCNEPVAITAKIGCDEAVLQCIKCHAITNP
jgi:hypothetical protein